MSRLRLVTGRAGSGKTAFMLGEIRERAASGETGLILLVPDQFSYEAERLLCETCGDGISLHAEVLSFKRLFHRLISDMGGLDQDYIDRAGKFLVMRRAVALTDEITGAAPAGQRVTDRILSLLDTAADCRSSRIQPERLYALADRTDGLLRNKLRYLASVMEIYNGLLRQDLHDPDEMLDRMCDLIPHSARIAASSLWIDGFRDFSAQQFAVLEQLLAFSDSVTVSLTADASSEEEMVFHTASVTKNRLTELAAGIGASVDEVICHPREGTRSPEMQYLEKHCFTDRPLSFGSSTRVRLWNVHRDRDEFEACASSILTCVRDGVRYRDIAVAVGNLSGKESLFRSVMDEYGIPIYINSKKDIMRYPPTAVLLSSLNVLLRGWDAESVFAYLKSGYADITADECDLLENYAFTWGIRGRKWTADRAWDMPTDGLSGNTPDGAALETLNDIRRRVCAPLTRLEKAMRSSPTGAEKIRALFRFADDIGLYVKTEELSGSLRLDGDEGTADELLSACEILTVAAEQFLLTAGDMNCELQEFAQLWTALLEQYDFGFIPDTTDRVCAGDISRIRRRGIRHLYVLGASDELLPSIPPERGIFSEEEREQLSRIDSVFSPPIDERLAVGQADAYELLTQPGECLTLSFSEESGTVPSRYFSILRDVFSVEPQVPERTRCQLSAPGTSLELALTGPAGDLYADAARRYWQDSDAYVRIRADIEAACHPAERAISEASAHSLYGNEAVLSSSRLEQYANCPFSYFLEYGMKLKERPLADLSPLVFGNLYHAVMENTSAEIMRSGGFHAVSGEECQKIAERHIKECLSSVSALTDDNARLRFLLGMTSEDILSAVRDLSEEMRSSKFVPMAFEMDFSPRGPLPPYEIRTENGRVILQGKIDRVDGWENEGSLYLRIIDYKTGRRTFRLSDVLYGRNLQMLIYLFALKEYGPTHFGRPVVPAGILYAHQEGEYVDASPDVSDEQRQKLLKSNRKHTGLVLADLSVCRAMDMNDPPVYLPVTFRKDGTLDTKSTYTARQEILLSRFVERRIGALCKGILAGDIRSLRRDAQGNGPCKWCRFRSVCCPEKQPLELQKALNEEEAWRQIEGGGEA